MGTQTLAKLCDTCDPVMALSQDADELQQHTQQVTSRAKEAIAASEAASGRLKTGSEARACPSSAPFLKGSSRLSPADQQHISSLEAQVAELQSAVEVTSRHLATECNLCNPRRVT